VKRRAKPQTSKEFSAAVGRALRRAAKVAGKTARMHGTPIYIWKDGKVVAEKPQGRPIVLCESPQCLYRF
jgi:hypothetical protein